MEHELFMSLLRYCNTIYSKLPSTLETDLFFDTKPRPAGFNINLEIN